MNLFSKIKPVTYTLNKEKPFLSYLFVNHKLLTIPATFRHLNDLMLYPDSLVDQRCKLLAKDRLNFWVNAECDTQKFLKETVEDFQCFRLTLLENSLNTLTQLLDNNQDIVALFIQDIKDANVVNVPLCDTSHSPSKSDNPGVYISEINLVDKPAVKLPIKKVCSILADGSIFNYYRQIDPLLKFCFIDGDLYSLSEESHMKLVVGLANETLPKTTNYIGPTFPRTIQKFVFDLELKQQLITALVLNHRLINFWIGGNLLIVDSNDTEEVSNIFIRIIDNQDTKSECIPTPPVYPSANPKINTKHKDAYTCTLYLSKDWEIIFDHVLGDGGFSIRNKFHLTPTEKTNDSFNQLNFDKQILLYKTIKTQQCRNIIIHALNTILNRFVAALTVEADNKETTWDLNTLLNLNVFVYEENAGGTRLHIKGYLTDKLFSLKEKAEPSNEKVDSDKPDNSDYATVILETDLFNILPDLLRQSMVVKDDTLYRAFMDAKRTEQSATKRNVVMSDFEPFILTDFGSIPLANDKVEQLIGVEMILFPKSLMGALLATLLKIRKAYNRGFLVIHS